ncbi:LAMI_0G08086g1_1 [Lachancea mirantina]|uniref:LAMI_0G08086g1_1 n=1 Tax=Lachancea mirantina TaxID=1230905 RepID=A0A1G4K9S6_9SACH|nr:LAMI_0G08086g1_1 [Lachancea mirantina]
MSFNNCLKTGTLLRRAIVRNHGTSTSIGIDSTVENNLKTESNRLSKTLNRFWEKVTIEQNDGQLKISLDGKPLKTPLSNELSVSQTQAPLAHFLKREWSNLSDLTIRPHSLPLTSIVSRCIDLTAVSDPHCDPELVTKIGGNRNTICQGLLRYLDTDTLLCFSPKDEFEGALRRAQEKEYMPLIRGVEQFLSPYVKNPVSLKILDADLHGLRGNAQTQETKEAAMKFLSTLSPWNLAVFEKTVLTTKSFICGLLLILNKTYIPSAALKVSMEQVARLATLETIYQTERWGEVEDTHDVDKRDVRRNVNAAAIAAYQE